jgi:hypothetical protein
MNADPDEAILVAQEIDVGKGNPHVCGLCSHVFGLLAQFA